MQSLGLKEAANVCLSQEKKAIKIKIMNFYKYEYMCNELLCKLKFFRVFFYETLPAYQIFSVVNYWQ